MNNQEATDTVVRHLISQGEQSVTSDPNPMLDGRCVYRNDAGLKCAVGVLIPDSEYVPEMDNSESSGVVDLINKFDPPSLRGLDTQLLQRLQMVHDSEMSFRGGKLSTKAIEEISHIYDFYGLSASESIKSDLSEILIFNSGSEFDEDYNLN